MDVDIGHTRTPWKPSIATYLNSSLLARNVTEMTFNNFIIHLPCSLCACSTRCTQTGALPPWWPAPAPAPLRRRPRSPIQITMMAHLCLQSNGVVEWRLRKVMEWWLRTGRCRLARPPPRLMNDLVKVAGSTRPVIVVMLGEDYMQHRCHSADMMMIVVPYH